MARRLLALASHASLSLCAASCALWVRSHVVPTRWERGPADPDRAVFSADGAIGMDNQPLVEQREAAMAAFEVRQARALMEFPIRGGLMRIVEDEAENDRRYREWEARWDSAEARYHAAMAALGPVPAVPPRWRLAVPWPVVALAFALPPLTRTAWAVRRRRRAARSIQCGHCPACGYDLRATPGRCPECGATPATAG